MAGRWRIVPMIALAMSLLGIAAAIPGVGNAAARDAVVIGIVEYARGNMVTVAGKTYDTREARFKDGHGVPLANPSDLRGKTVEILFRNGRIETVTIYPTLPQ